MNNFMHQLSNLINLMALNLKPALMVLAFFWAVFFLNVLLGRRLNILGIYPRHPWGLLGIVFSPFLHGDFSHLFFNSFPLFVLTDFLLIEGLDRYLAVSAIIIFLSGLATWLFGRRGIHIGASGLIMGYFGYLLINAYWHPSLASILLAILCLYYFGSLVFSLFPSQEKVSWEGHVFGFLAGLAAAYLV